MPCKKCGDWISNDVYDYSMDVFDKPLCMDCQKKLLGKFKPKSTPEAKKLYNTLKKQGIPVEEEKYDGYKHIDIAIPLYKLNIEIDGKHHNLSSKQAFKDLQRTYYSFRKGYITLRIPNSLVKTDNLIKQTVCYIKKFLKTIERQKQ